MLPLYAKQIEISNKSSDIKIWSYKTNDIVVSVDYIMDITGDGIPEVIAGSQSTSSSTVYLLSGADGKELWHYNNWEYFYQVLTQTKGIPDVTGDDKPDVLVALLGGVYVLNGINGRKAWSIDITGYARINYIDDVTNDGKPEVIIGATSEVKLVSGVDGKKLWTFFKSDFECTTITSLPDVTGDGSPDVLCGSGNNFVYLLNSANGKMFWEFEADGLISSLSHIPDVSGDDIYDVLIGSAKGTVYLVSGCDGAELWNYKAESAITYLDGIVCIPDVTGDGNLDVIIGSYDSNIYLLDCKNKQVVWKFKTDNKVESVAYIPDVNGDGYVDVLAGSRDKKIYLIDGKFGNKIWDYETEGYVYSVSCIPDVSGDGYFDIIAGSTDHNVYCLNSCGPQTTPPKAYMLHIESYPITGIKISYSGDYSGTGITNFDIGPKNSPFTVTLTAPSAYQDYTFDHWQLDGINAGKDLTITIKLDDQNKERTAVAFYSQNINDFSISVAQQRYAVLPGESITCYLNITSINDFDSTVSLALTISPDTDDIKLSLESTNIKPPKNGFTIVALYVSALPNAKVGNYKISVVGTSGSLSRSDDFILEISTLSNLVKIGEILTTLYNVSYQEENTYISVPIFNFGSNPQTITLSASTNSKDWSIAPSTLKVRLRPSTYLKNKGFLVGYNLVFFNLKFGSKADFKGNFTITIDETSEKKVLEMEVYSAISKSILIGVEKSAAYVFLPLSYGHLGGLGIPNDKKVKDFALSVLKNEGIDENANEEVKLKAIFKYVLNHMEFGIRVPPPTIYTIVDEIEKDGGVSGKHKITGDCKVYSFFFGGLAKALGFDVRLVCGIMEASTDVLHMVTHTWVEVKVNKKWIFVDPTSGLFNRTYSDQQTLPDNLDLDAFDAKKAYELDPQWGGPLTATGYRGGLAFDDLISEYKFSIPPTPEGLVLTAHSPITIYLYDKNWNLINISLPYRIFWVGPNYTMGSYEDGLWIYSPKMLDEYYVKLVGTGSGSFSLCALYMNASSSKFATFNGTIKEGEELLLKIEVDSEGEPTFALVKKEDGLMKVLSIITIIVIIACIPTYIFIRKKYKKKEK
jgi:outer membrane protein assembly factor BamB